MPISKLATCDNLTAEDRDFRLTRKVDQHPFVPHMSVRDESCRRFLHPGGRHSQALATYTIRTPYHWHFGRTGQHTGVARVCENNPINSVMTENEL